MAEPQAFDWPALMRAGLHGLRLDPGTFWNLTPAELQVLLGHGSGDIPMGRARLEELAAAYPDTKGTDDE